MPTSSRPPTESSLLRRCGDRLARQLPSGWTLTLGSTPSAEEDGRLRLRSADDHVVTFLVEVKQATSAAELRAAVAWLRARCADLDARPLLLAPWLGPAARSLLEDLDVAYADATGNARIVADRPALFIRTEGAPRNPWPADSSLKSVRGRGAMRALRALLDHAPPYGVRELAGRSSASAATLSRVIALLEQEALVDRDERGAVTELDWRGTIRRWALDYDVLETHRATSFLAPRGLAGVVHQLRTSSLRYAITGSWAARELAPIAPARLALVYVEDPLAAASTLELRESEVGTNIMLLEPYSDVVFERAQERDGLVFTHPSQLAVDLLTGPGRAPQEGEALLRWMHENEHAWRA